MRKVLVLIVGFLLIGVNLYAGDLIVNGKVGVGTTNPNGLLEISAAGGSKSFLKVSDTMASADKLLHLVGTGIGSGSHFIYTQDETGGKNFVVRGDGNVGIGTSSPGAKLHVAGSNILTNNNYGYSGYDTGSAAVVLLKIDTSDNTVLNAKTGKNIIFGIGTTEKVRITSDGKVGIGTTGPSGMLEVSSVGGSKSFLKVSDTSASADKLLHLVGSGIGSGSYFIYTQDSSGGTNFVVRGDGRVGIGMTSPAYNLHVNGSFAASTKYFDIPDPRYSDLKMRLIHSTLEGPEIGVYYRGEGQLENGKAIIKLPDYFEALTSKDNRTVLLTPKFENEDEPIVNLAASAPVDGKFIVRAIDMTNPNQKFYWEVKAVRKDIEPLKVEVSRSEDF